MIRDDLRGLMQQQLVQQLRQNSGFLDHIAAEVLQILGTGRPASTGRILTIVNQSTTATDADFQAAVAAVNQQVQSDFSSAWGLSGLMIIAGSDTPAERIYVLDNSDQAGALGYHEEDPSRVPVGYVFVADAIAAGDDWAATLSHETLEQVIDPWCNAVAVAPLPDQSQQVGVALEVCDPVENDEYQVGGRQVSNFVLPEWFNPGFSGPVDQMGNLQSAGQMSPGGYIAFTPDLQSWAQIFGAKVPGAQQGLPPFSRRSRRWQRAVRKGLAVKK